MPPRSSLPIDRAAFVSLTMTMAGLACNTGPSPSVAGVVEIPPQPPQPADAGVASAPKGREEEPDKLRASPSSAASADAESDEEGATTAPTTEGGGIVAVARGSGCGWVDPAKVPRPPAACSDDRGVVGTCNATRSCQRFAFPKRKCEAYRKYFKPRVAQRALECLSKLNDKQACDACNAYRCGDLAMKSACPDASTGSLCLQITTQCKSIAIAECKTYLSGLNAAGRAKMAACLTGPSGCSFGIFSCAEGLF